MKASIPSTSFFKTACLFEGSLAVLACGLGWLGGIDPWADLHFDESTLIVGIIGTIPLFVLLLALDRLPYPTLRHIKQLLLDTLGNWFDQLHVADLAILAAVAGFCEELLFRGVIQPGLERLTQPVTGLLLSNVLFGLVHAITPFYAVLAGLVGLYLGLAMDYGGPRNLLTPMVIHGLYDFLAFLALRHAYRQTKPPLA